MYYGIFDYIYPILYCIYTVYIYIYILYMMYMHIYTLYAHSGGTSQGFKARLSLVKVFFFVSTVEGVCTFVGEAECLSPHAALCPACRQAPLAKAHILPGKFMGLPTPIYNASILAYFNGFVFGSCYQHAGQRPVLLLFVN